jgi:mannose-6-phosphate isomerase-like protein (cupin superfamily)
MRKLKRIVTGQNSRGRSIVALEGPPDPILEFIPGAGLFEIWVDGGRSSLDNLPGPASLLPPVHGIKCRWFTVLPVPPGVGAAELAAFYDASFTAMAKHNIRPDTSRHPGMHRTKTLDFIIVIEGRVRLILDEEDRVLGPGDVVVQRSTNHAWSCVGDVPALLVAVLIDKTAPVPTSEFQVEPSTHHAPQADKPCET